MQKYSAFQKTQISATSLAVRARFEGRFAIVTERWVQDAMDAARVRQLAAGRERARRTAKSCGPGAATVASSWQEASCR
jgi:hypothetical protein